MLTFSEMNGGNDRRNGKDESGIFSYYTVLTLPLKQDSVM